jgi:alkylation response protein AidB-like acyl-CoA dehydrogenase
VDLRFSDSERAFRTELRAWLAEMVPSLPPKPPRDDWPARRDYDTHWQRLLFDAGYAGINWPKEYGGRGATPTEHLIYLEESERAKAPYVGVNFVGLLHGGPTLIVEGTDEQRSAHLPRILRGEEVWCQGFSEPNAGSDLASLRCRAVRDGDEYVINGQKIWTSHAEVADFCELLVRTDPDAPKHKGITWVIVPMDAPGIQIRPLRTLVGSNEFSEVFFDDVRVPVSSRVGDENDGWRVTMVTLSFERGTAFVSDVVNSMVTLHDVAERTRATAYFPELEIPTDKRHLGEPFSELETKIGQLAAELDALWALTLRGVSEATHTGVPGPSASVFKLRYSEVRQRVNDVAMEVLGDGSLAMSDVSGPGSGAMVEDWLNSLSYTIAAGTSQIQRNIIAERLLGLPKELKA